MSCAFYCRLRRPGQGPWTGLHGSVQKPRQSSPIMQVDTPMHPLKMVTMWTMSRASMAAQRCSSTAQKGRSKIPTTDSLKLTSATFKTTCARATCARAKRMRHQATEPLRSTFEPPHFSMTAHRRLSREIVKRQSRQTRAPGMHDSYSAYEHALCTVYALKSVRMPWFHTWASYASICL